MQLAVAALHLHVEFFPSGIVANGQVRVRNARRALLAEEDLYLLQPSRHDAGFHRPTLSQVGKREEPVKTDRVIAPFERQRALVCFARHNGRGNVIGKDGPRWI
jgi:hypothetical protein